MINWLLITIVMTTNAMTASYYLQQTSTYCILGQFNIVLNIDSFNNHLITIHKPLYHWQHNVTDCFNEEVMINALHINNKQERVTAMETTAIKC